MVRALLAVIFCLGGSAISWCQTSPIQFTAYPPNSLAQKLMGDHAWRIYASGEIDDDAAQRLATLIAQKHIPANSLLFLHSPGGNLQGGMKLGRVIRDNLLLTYIGQLNATTKSETKPGYCYSACALAFLGGEYRYLPEGSMYGVHRFFWKEHTNADADLAQIISADVVEYIRSMGVDTRIFALAAQAGPTEVITPSIDTLRSLNVINEGSKPVRWTIESTSMGIHLKGEQETALGMTKFMIMCPARGPVLLYAIFSAGQNTDDVMKWPTHWLFLDEKQMQIDDRHPTKAVVNGWINLFFPLDEALVAKIAGAKFWVGVGLSPAPRSAIFSGFSHMPFEGGASKLPGFLQVCGRRYPPPPAITTR